MKYEEDLERLILLLEKSQEECWPDYFKDVLVTYKTGDEDGSYKKVLSAYGGMCSFNDLTLSFISAAEVSEIEAIRSSLWDYCQKNKKKLWGIF